MKSGTVLLYMNFFLMKNEIVVKPNITPYGRWLYKTEYFGLFLNWKSQC